MKRAYPTAMMTKRATIMMTQNARPMTIAVEILSCFGTNSVVAFPWPIYWTVVPASCDVSDVDNAAISMLAWCTFLNYRAVKFGKNWERISTIDSYSQYMNLTVLTWHQVNHILHEKLSNTLFIFWRISDCNLKARFCKSMLCLSQTLSARNFLQLNFWYF